MRALSDLMASLNSITDQTVRHIRKTAETPPRVSVLDAHQMSAARPGIQVGGQPPGLWQQSESRGWHFNPALSPRDLEKARSLTPPSAAGEMNHALANRLWDVICP